MIKKLIQRFRDWHLENQISECHAMIAEAEQHAETRSVAKRYARKLEHLVQRRSPEQIARMEKDKFGKAFD